jgi:hypothetical protein
MTAFSVIASRRRSNLAVKKAGDAHHFVIARRSFDSEQGEEEDEILRSLLSPRMTGGEGLPMTTSFCHCEPKAKQSPG